MNIAGYQGLTLQDYPGKLASIIFAQGCNIRCPYCHNEELLSINKIGNIDEKTVMRSLTSHRQQLEGVVISGGEPTIQSDIIPFIKRITQIKGTVGHVKLDTNGTRPYVLKQLLNENLLDYVAMDIKNDYQYYLDFIQNIHKESRVKTNNEMGDAVRESIKLIINSGVDHEFRITVAHPLHDNTSFGKIGKDLIGAKRIFLQNYKKYQNSSNSMELTSFEIDELKMVQKTLLHYVEYVKIRGEE